MADENSISGQELAFKGVIAIEGVKSRLENVEKVGEKTLEQLNAHAELMKDVRNILGRIATAEEERTAAVKEAERDRRSENLRLSEQRSMWFNRLWENKAVQLLLMGVVMFLLQLLGFGWMAERIGVQP